MYRMLSIKTNEPNPEIEYTHIYIGSGITGIVSVFVYTHSLYALNWTKIHVNGVYIQ